MSQAPSMPMFWDAYIADTTHLTTEEHGAYLLLLGAMWRRNGWVPDDDRDNARILGLTPAKWKRIKGRLSGFLTFEDGEITQKNLLKIWKITQEKIDQNRKNGSKGGRPRSNKNKDLGKPDGSVSVNPNETIPEPEPEPKDTIANAMDGEAVDSSSDAKEIVWSKCLEWMMSKGVPETKARGFIGKCFKERHPPEKIRSAFNVAKAAKTGDPIPYITAILNKPEQLSVHEMMTQAKEINANR